MNHFAIPTPHLAARVGVPRQTLATAKKTMDYVSTLERKTTFAAVTSVEQMGVVSVLLKENHVLQVTSVVMD